jgi:hypothetical protein
MGGGLVAEAAAARIVREVLVAGLDELDHRVVVAGDSRRP